MQRHIQLAGAVAALVIAAVPARAADIHERGTIASVDGATVKVETRDGKMVSLDLDDGWAIAGVAKSALADIKPGSFIGTAAMADTPDSLRALEVVVFPEKMRGTGEGHYPWDLEPKSSMTNATVSKQVKDVDGQTVTLAYKGGEKKVTIKDDTPVVTVIDGSKADLVTGAKVFVSTPAETDGKMQKGVIVVGKDGLTPPM